MDLNGFGWIWMDLDGFYMNLYGFYAIIYGIISYNYFFRAYFQFFPESGFDGFMNFLCLVSALIQHDGLEVSIWLQSL